MITKNLSEKKLIHPPSWLPDNVMYEVIMGSEAYGVSSDSSDKDIYGFAIPPKETLFPHLAGEICGFGTQKPRFEQFQQHHIKDEEKQYDISIYNIAKYFQLIMENNPNMIDSLFVPQNCVLHTTHISELLRDNRKMFLHKGSWHKFKGYAYSQLNKMSHKNAVGKRIILIEKYGFDVKFAYHVVRLLYEVEMILTEGDIDLQRHREHLKSIRRGEISEKEIRDWASSKEKALEAIYHSCSLPYGPDEKKIKKLLLECLEHHYGNLDKCVAQDIDVGHILNEIQDVINRYKK